MKMIFLQIKKDLYFKKKFDKFEEKVLLDKIKPQNLLAYFFNVI